LILDACTPASGHLNFLAWSVRHEFRTQYLTLAGRILGFLFFAQGGRIVARINIEDKIYRDERFHRLSAFEGKYKALGLCVTAWDLAHRWYLKHPEHLIPLAEWDASEELRLLEKFGLAERREKGIYVKGSKDECEYLTDRQSAGRKGGLKSQENFSSKRKQIEQNQPSSSSSISSTNSNKNIHVESDVVAEASEGKFTPNDLVSLWNDKADPSLARVIRLTDKRKRQAQTALRDYPEADFWNDVINLVNASNFLRGLGPVSGDRSKAWRCDFDFIIRSDNALKIIEGKYS